MARIVQGSMFAVIAISITASIHYYIWARLVRDTQLTAPWHTLATLAIILLGISIPATFIASRSLPLAWVKPAVYAPYVWMGMMLLFLTVLVGLDIAKVFYHVALKVTGEAPPDPTRRVFLARAGAALTTLVVGGMTSLAIRTGALDPLVMSIGVTLSKLPHGFDGFKIVQITDLHVGLTLDGPWLDKVVDQVNALKPDLIAITGDVMDGSVDRLLGEVAPLARLEAKEGVFFVTGNHEYYSGVTRWLPALESLGLRILRNERVTLERDGEDLVLAGVDDFSARGMASGHGPNLPKALNGRKPEQEVVLLAHQPLAVAEASEWDVGLVLAGHTHGGQIWPWNHFVRLQQPYCAGLHRYGKHTQIYVSAGTGYWGPPMRLGTTGEISLITLKSAKKGGG